MYSITEDNKNYHRCIPMIYINDIINDKDYRYFKVDNSRLDYSRFMIMFKELILEISPNIIKYDYANDILKIHDDILINETGTNINLQPKNKYILILYFSNKKFKCVSYKAYTCIINGNA
jgi:hypothetical protein